jgi:hypothetical protein
MQNFMFYVFPLVLIACMAWAITHAIRSQKKNTVRLQGIAQTGERNFSDVMDLTKRQLAVSEQTLEELRAVRHLLEEKNQSKL